MNGGNAGNVCTVPDVISGIIEELAVIPDETGLLDAFTGMLDTAAVDPGVENGDLDRWIAGRDVPALGGIDIRIRCTGHLYRITEQVKGSMELPGIVQSPLLLKIFPAGNNPARIRPRVIALVRDDQYPVEIGFGKFDIRVGMVAGYDLFHSAAGHFDHVNTDGGNFLQFPAAGLAVYFANLGGCGSRVKPDQYAVRRIPGHLGANQLSAGGRLISRGGRRMPGASGTITGWRRLKTGRSRNQNTQEHGRYPASDTGFSCIHVVFPLQVAR